MVVKSNTYKDFVKFLGNKVNEASGINLDQAYGRSCKFQIFKSDKSLTPEAQAYLNKNGEFEFNKIILPKEVSMDDGYLSKTVSSFIFKRSISGKDLVELCESFQDDEDEEFRNSNFMINDSSKDNNLLNSIENSNQLQPITANESNSDTRVSKSLSTSFHVNSIYNDLPKLKKTFGIFKLFQDVEPETWIEKVEVYLSLNYSSDKDVIIEYFYIFLMIITSGSLTIVLNLLVLKNLKANI